MININALRILGKDHEDRCNFETSSALLEGASQIESLTARLAAAEGERDERHSVTCMQAETMRSLQAKIAALTAALETELEELGKRTIGSTHWSGCEKSHPMCAAMGRITKALALTRGEVEKP